MTETTTKRGRPRLGTENGGRPKVARSVTVYLDEGTEAKLRKFQKKIGTPYLSEAVRALVKEAL